MDRLSAAQFLLNQGFKFGSIADIAQLGKISSDVDINFCLSSSKAIRGCTNDKSSFNHRFTRVMMAQFEVNGSKIIGARYLVYCNYIDLEDFKESVSEIISSFEIFKETRDKSKESTWQADLKEPPIKD